MQLHSDISSALNRHATIEAASAFMYYSMASWFENKGFRGFANWCRIEAEGEMTHMIQFFDYINMRGCQVAFETIEPPPTSWNAVLEVFEEIYKQECLLTVKINDMVNLAHEHKDNATDSFLHTFIIEQIKDEAEAGEILNQIRMVGEDGRGLLMISAGLRNRKAPPA